MKLDYLRDKEKGWFVGDFDLATLRTKDAEVAIKHYKAGAREPYHHHKIAKELTVIISGTVEMDNRWFVTGDIITIEPGESTNFVAIEDTITCVVKTPSVPNDKYLD